MLPPLTTVTTPYSSLWPVLFFIAALALLKARRLYTDSRTHHTQCSSFFYIFFADNVATTNYCYRDYSYGRIQASGQSSSSSSPSLSSRLAAFILNSSSGPICSISSSLGTCAKSKDGLKVPCSLAFTRDSFVYAGIVH